MFEQVLLHEFWSFNRNEPKQPSNKYGLLMLQNSAFTSADKVEESNALEGRLTICTYYSYTEICATDFPKYISNSM